MHRHKISRRMVLAAVISLILYGCSESHKKERDTPNIIMIVIDTTRADHLSIYGYERDTTPNLSEFAKSSVVFSRAIAPAPWTLPSFTSMLLGKHAYNHNLNKSSTGDIETTLANIIKDAGYKTVSIQTNEFLEGIDSSFDEQHHYFIGDGVQLDQYAISKAGQWLDNAENTSKKFFMFIGLISPHWKYSTNNGYLGDFVMDPLYIKSPMTLVSLPGGAANGILYNQLDPTLQALLGEPADSEGYYRDSRLYVAAYDSEIRYTDSKIEELFDKLKQKDLFDDSIIIITADHGENMTDHDVYFSHGDNLYNSLLHVPLMIKLPNQSEQKTVSEYVRTIDILPTIIDYIGADPGEIDGKSLMPIINGETVDFEERPVISYREHEITGERTVSVIKDGFKLIRGTFGYELYNLMDDPNETLNRAYVSSDRDTNNSLNDHLSKYYQY